MRRLAKPAAVTAAAVAVALVTTGCGAADEPSADTGETSASPAPEAAPLWFTSVTTEGDDFDASSLAGQDVVLWFWAPWCTICRSEAPEVAEAAAEVEGSVELIGVASSGSVDQMQAFVSDTGTDSLTHIADVPGDIWRQFGVVAQPTFVFVDDDGRTQTFAGALGQEQLLDAMKQLAAA